MGGKPRSSEPGVEIRIDQEWLVERLKQPAVIDALARWFLESWRLQAARKEFCRLLVARAEVIAWGQLRVHD